MSSIPFADSHSPQPPPESQDFKSGILPSRDLFSEGTERPATLSRDGMLHVGSFRLCREVMIKQLDTFARVATRVVRYFPNEEALVRVLPNGEIPVPPASIGFGSAYETFKLVQSQEIRDVDFLRGSRKIESLKEGGLLSGDDIEFVRDLLMKGARLATVCAGIDQAMEAAQSYRSMVKRGKDWLVDHAGSVGVRDGRIQARLREMPFEDFDVRSLRIDADLMAQRIALRDDGSIVVASVSRAEHQAAALLQRGALSRRVALSRAGIEGELSVRNDRGEALYAETHRVPEVFSALQLGKAASRLLSDLARQRVDLVRLCRFMDRPTAMGLKICLGAIPQQAHTRLGDVDEWASRFESKRPLTISDDERADLGAQLLDAHLCLLVASHLQVVTQSDDARAFWRRLWGGAIGDRDVQAAQGLVSTEPSPLTCDCAGAAEVLGNAAMLLGYHAEDRTGAGWRAPENPVVSLTWAMTRS